MRFRHGGVRMRATQSSIDVALWVIIEDVMQDFGHKRKTYGYLLTYVDDFLLIGPLNIRNAIEEEISKIWKIKVEGSVNQYDEANPEASLTFLSTVIRSHPIFGGFTMSQEAFVRDVLKTWEMTNCRSLVQPGEPGEKTPLELPVEKDVVQDDVYRAQKLSGSLIWLSTRTRPDITDAQSRISSMATKAPKRAFLEGMRVLRYLNGTKYFDLQFRACKNSDEVIAYTDANFSVQRSQTGAVIKLGVNVVAWRSMKQTESTISTAASEVQALASTEVMAEFIRTLRESLCLSTPVVMIKCDNTGAIVLATGEGSWRTKSAANKVHQVKERVQNGLVEVTYVSTHDQCADSRTKYLKGAEPQKKANLQLSLIDLDSWLPGKDLITRAKKVRFHDNRFGIFQPVAKRIFCSGPDSFKNEETLYPEITLKFLEN